MNEHLFNEETKKELIENMNVIEDSNLMSSFFILKAVTAIQ